ncbi:hypothetical protein JGI7_01611 [Candidatus Kryptonium thompsonii]|mgnify:FL=1|uniref:Copper chaperone NosL n=1 Tax=Candidatus Kryptonium thompsonii TaxID=1633631 RepID=A0A0N7MP55_9BACT|nr:hypothetical protein [Candidatus Kryptonium thompsoni]CUS78099.1 hypothetical protein JGI15_100313 [Candidatus Kryptonium thompsoni]CUS78991.1 hypothetical protein JGI16_101515 [Candidatus Kryptonium thompsoni]CUS84769.1 hypothetical protein JGI13_01103 [Candidatus Kryptonium thompsoni]CUS85806.1 hypothetical protein JGI6_01077 [Candidatus Kryptonium thompsoni]CUS89942.1 hypothetical protein JGI12_01310 [Candidatus Kryptonium thompsoni]
MERILQKWEKFQDTPLNLKSRIALLISVLFLLAVFFFPLWRMQFFATFYPDGLKLYIYSYKLEGGKTAGRDDLREINTLNHYIGMKPLSQSDFPEFTYLPFVFGALGLLVLRAIILGKVSTLIDLIVMYSYIGIFSILDFYNKLYTYGHNLAPDAPIKVQPFTPPLFGKKMIAQFTVYSYPSLGSLGLFLSLIVLVIALFLTLREVKPSE